MPSPVILANNVNTTAGAIDVASGATVTLAIQNPSGVNVWKIECFGTDETSDINSINTQLTANKNNVALTSSFVSGLAGTTLNFRSTINNGIDVDGRTARPDYIQTFQICVPINNSRVLAMEETLESDPQFGWLAKFNRPIRSGVTATSPFTAGGDLTGSNTAQIVSKIQGVTIAGTPANGRLIIGTSATSASWSDPTFAFTAGGDLGGTNVNQTVIRLNGATVPAAGSLAVGQLLKVSGSAATSYGFLTDSNVDPAAAIAGSKISPNFGGQLVQTTNTVQAPTLTLGAGGPTITTGTGSPATSPPAGSLYLQTNGTLYARNSSSAWIAVGIGSAGGDLAGSFPNPTVVSLTGAANVVLSNAPTIRFVSTVVNPLIQQAADSTANVTGDSLTLQAQSTTGTGSIGGNLVLSSGGGVSSNGIVNIQAGGATILSLASANLGTMTKKNIVEIENADNYTTNTQVINNVLSTDATVQNLASGSLPNGVTLIDTVITAFKNDYTVAAMYRKTMVYRVNAGTPTAVGTLSDGGSKVDSGASGWSAVIDNSGATWRVRVTGAAGVTIRWSSTTITRSTNL